MNYSRGPARRDVVSLAGYRSGSGRRPKGITNDQAHQLAVLQRQLGERYTGRGMTARQARKAIRACLERLTTPPARRQP